jgi:hypothetical protein
MRARLLDLLERVNEWLDDRLWSMFDVELTKDDEDD